MKEYISHIILFKNLQFSAEQTYSDYFPFLFSYKMYYTYTLKSL